ncbi:MAG: signal peptide peptidase SppA [Cryomorphaceae bacterium]|nr:signal peptide peptidase SppA [Cryomorphaceae bacterium]
MKIFFASFFGVLAALFFLILIGIGFAGMSEEAPKIEPQTTLVLQLSGAIQDRPTSSLALLNELLDQPNTTSLTETLLALKAAADDDRVKALRIEMGLFDMGYASIQELRSAMKHLQDMGKPVVVYSKLYTQKAFYLARAAEKVYLPAPGMIEFSGLSTSPLYFKGALDKLGVKAHLIRGSDNIYKSAGEPFIADEMSDANRHQIEERLQSLYSGILEDLEADGVDTEALNQRITENPLFSAEEALAMGLIEGIQYTWPTGDDATEMMVEDYYHALEAPSAKKSIAVLIAEGDVQDGSGSDGVITDESMREAIEKIRKQKRIGAVVLRINSPGGSALASDMIWDALQNLAKEKPLVISMGDVAASGGYYIAVPGQTLFANPATITGSIGVFGLLFSAEDLLHNTLGVKSQPVGTHPLSTALQLDQAPSSAMLAVLQKNVDRTYTRFKAVVAEGRALAQSQVDSLARGHVYTGRDALRLGLIDQEGGFLQALSFAQDLAYPDEEAARIVFYPEDMDPLTQLLSSLGAKTQMWWNAWSHQGALKAFSQLQERVMDLQAWEGVQMRAQTLNL